MSVEAIFVAIVLVAVLVVLVREWLPPVVVFLLAIGVLVAGNVITAEQAFSGFSNPALFIIGSLFVIAHAVERTTNLESWMYRFLGRKGDGPGALARLMVPVAFLSGFINNTPVVSMLVPQVGKWARKHGVSASALLMPLSFAAVLGGTLTLIGTSTTVAVSGLLTQYGYQPFDFFEVTVVGLPIAIIGIGVLLITSRKLLPRRKSIFDEDDELTEKFTFEAVVEPALDGKTVAEADLRNMQNAFLYALVRDGQVISPVSPRVRLQKGDIVSFTGQADAIQRITTHKGLTSPEEEHINSLQQSKLTYYEAIIGSSSPLVGKTLKEIGFRSKYQAAVVAIHRSGERIDAKPGSVKLQAGDTLLLIADEQFRERWSYRNDFLAIFPLDIQHTSSDRHGTVLLGILGLALTAVIADVLPLAAAALLAAGAIVAVGTLSFAQAKNAIDFEILVMIGAAFGLARAVSVSGVAETIADALSGSLEMFGAVGILAGIILATVVLTELITNSAAALLMLPIALSAADNLSVDPRLFAIAVAIAASASFLTPIGYQTNTMVYGPGGYKFTDYARLGLPLTIVVITVLLVVIPQLW